MGLKVLITLGYYEVGGFMTVVNNLSKYLTALGVEVTVAARVVRIEPPKYVNLVKLRPEDLPAEGKHYDVIHIHTSYPYTRVAVEHNIRNLVFTWHGYAPTIYVPGIRNKVINLGLRYAYRRLLPKIRFITSVSNYANYLVCRVGLSLMVLTLSYLNHAQGKSVMVIQSIILWS
jgi:glycosyltransferase involved in cell wall biosynthesis